MKLLLFLFSLRALGYMSGCASSKPAQQTPVQNTYITPCESTIESATNSGYQDGFSSGKALGISEGKTLGYANGFETGKSLGYQYGLIAGADSVMEGLKKLKDPHYEPAIWQYYRDKSVLGDIAQMRENIAREAYLTGKMAGEVYSYSLGYQEGYGRAFDSLFDIRVQIGSMLKHPDVAAKLTIDYAKVADLMHQIQGNNKHVETAAFSEALWEIHNQILQGLAITLNLSPEESREVMARYQEIHQSLSDAYYIQYRKRCHSEITDYTKTFYDYRYYHSVDAFFDIAESGICLVADMSFTYAKNSCAYCATHGFKVMGNICELLIGTVMVPLRDYTLKYGIMRDYEKCLPGMVRSVREILDNIVMENRSVKKTITQTVSLSGGIISTITMEIETVLEIGLKTETFRYIPSHDNQEMQAVISNEPRLKSAKQTYKITAVENSISCGTPNCSTSGTLSTALLNNIFEAHRDQPSSLPEARYPVEKNIDEILIPVLIKFAEPALALPHSCYNLVFQYGPNPPKELVKIECENAVSPDRK